jgi:hypothetical protein
MRLVLEAAGVRVRPGVLPLPSLSEGGVEGKEEEQQGGRAAREEGKEENTVNLF